MSTVTRPRGPLPARVYWARRLLVLLVALALVFGIARLLGGGLGGGSEPQSARVVGSTSSSGTDAATTSATPSATPVADRAEDEAAVGEAAEDRARTRKKKALPEPDGPCDSADVRITPRVEEAHAGSPVPIRLELTTRESEACTWEVSPDTVVLKLTSGTDPIWTSQECPAAIPTQQVVPRRKKPDTVTVMWNAKRSDSECSPATDWALPGWYHAEAVARGSVRPVDKMFELEGPVRRTITPSPTATPEPAAGDAGDRRKKDRDRRSAQVSTPTEGRR